MPETIRIDVSKSDAEYDIVRRFKDTARTMQHQRCGDLRKAVPGALIEAIELWLEENEDTNTTTERRLTRAHAERIRERDEHVCQKCGKTQEKNRRALGVVHLNGNPYDNDNDNLKSMCTYCQHQYSISHYSEEKKYPGDIVIGYAGEEKREGRAVKVLTEEYYIRLKDMLLYNESLRAKYYRSMVMLEMLENGWKRIKSNTRCFNPRCPDGKISIATFEDQERAAFCDTCAVKYYLQRKWAGVDSSMEEGDMPGWEK